jgi:hypothetical protein
MRLTPSDTVDHVDLNRSFRRLSSSHEERILRRNPPPASFRENFCLGSIFDFFNRIGHKPKSAPATTMAAPALIVLQNSKIPLQQNSRESS